MDHGERDEEDEASRGARRGHGADGDGDEGDESAGDGDGDFGGPACRPHLSEPTRKRAVARHRERHARGPEQVRVQRRQHREHASGDYKPVAGGAHEALRGHGHQPFRVRRRGCCDALGRRPHGGHEEEQREIDGEGDPERQVHGARECTRRIADFSAHGSDQVEALKSDERVAHRLQHACRTRRQEGIEPT